VPLEQCSKSSRKERKVYTHPIETQLPLKKTEEDTKEKKEHITKGAKWGINPYQ